MVKECIYGFGCEGIEPIILSAFLPQQIAVSFVPQSENFQTLGSIVGVPGAIHSDGASDGATIGAAMLLFAGFSDERLNLALAAMRRIGLSIPYKAVLTRNNEKWTPLHLFEELCAERAAIKEQRKAKQ